MQMVSDAPCEACHGHRREGRHGAARSARPVRAAGMQTSTSGGVFAVTEPCQRLPRPRAWSSTIRARSATAPAGAGRPRPCRSGSRPASPTGSGSGSRARAAPARTAAPPGDLYVIVHVRPHPVFGRKRRQPHPHRSGHLHRGGARRRDRGAHPRWAAGQAPMPAGHAERPYLPGPRQGRLPGATAPRATCWSPSRCVVPHARSPHEARQALDSYAEAVGESRTRGRSCSPRRDT